MNELKKWLKEAYDIEFIQEAYLIEAMTHRSYSNETRKKFYGLSNERMEFLGDAVLELFVSQLLYTHFPKYNEGELTQLRARIVREDSLMQLAIEAKLNQYILLGVGEEKSGARTRPALLCDLFEAFLGALYLDKGFEEASRFLTILITSKLKEGHFSATKDYKTFLQEYVQSKRKELPVYRLEEESGPAHQKQFKVSVWIDEQLVGTGVGSSKKIADQQAAKEALKTIQQGEIDECN